MIARLCVWCTCEFNHDLAAKLLLFNLWLGPSQLHFYATRVRSRIDHIGGHHGLRPGAECRTAWLTEQVETIQSVQVSVTKLSERWYGTASNVEAPDL